MENVFTLLKQAREAKGLSLADVSDTTFISIRFLEAIEAGKTDILPQAYVRAFIREYAAVVGLDGADVMRRYDAMTSRQPAPAASAPAADASASEGARPTAAPPPAIGEAPEAEPAPGPMPEAPLPMENREIPEESAPAPRRDLTDVIQKAAVVMGVAVIAIVLWNVMGIERPKTQEIPFQNVIKDNEQHAANSARKDSTRLPATSAARLDSLTLQAVTSDSVWVQVIVDGGTPREYLFRPNARATWKAADKFLLTIGNAGAVQLTLNKKDLGPLGKKGSVIQKLELTRQSVTR